MTNDPTEVKFCSAQLLPNANVFVTRAIRSPGPSGWQNQAMSAAGVWYDIADDYVPGVDDGLPVLPLAQSNA